MILRRSIVMLGLAACLAMPAGANLVVDGGFESPKVEGAKNPDGQLFYGVGNRIDAWILDGSGNDRDGYGPQFMVWLNHPVNFGELRCPEGVQCGMLRSYGNRSFPMIYQALKTTAGKTYKLKFALQTFPPGNSVPGQVKVTVGGLDETFTAPNTTFDKGWKYFERTFTAKTADDQLTFERKGTVDVLLDDISVDPAEAGSAGK